MHFFVNIFQINIIIAAVVDNRNNNNDNIVINNNNFPICYLGCLLTRQCHSEICKEDHGPSIFTCMVHTIDILSGYNH